MCLLADTRSNIRSHDALGSPWTPMMRMAALVGFCTTAATWANKNASPFCAARCVVGAPTQQLVGISKSQVGSDPRWAGIAVD